MYSGSHYLHFLSYSFNNNLLISTEKNVHAHTRSIYQNGDQEKAGKKRTS